MNTKTNNFFQTNQLTPPQPCLQQKQTKQQPNQQQQQQQQFHLALPIQSNHIITSFSSDSSSDSSHSSDSSLSSNHSSSTLNSKPSTKSSQPNPIQNIHSTQQPQLIPSTQFFHNHHHHHHLKTFSIDSIHSLIGSTISSPSTGTRYHLNRLLGQGTFSHVIQASSNLKSSHQSVALKLVRITSNSSQSTPSPRLIYKDQIPRDEHEFNRISTLREIEILKSLDHPSIIKLIETFNLENPEQEEKQDSNHTIQVMKQNSSLKVIVLEEIRGGELFELVSTAKHFLKPLIICRLMAELSIAVHWLHTNHIAHRDLKLENILLVRQISNEESTVEEMKTNRNVYLKITDFGLSVKMTKQNHHPTGNQYELLTSRCGSEEYAAPEIILGRMYDGRKTDAWALGVIGYSLVTGMLPFKLPQPYNSKNQFQDQDEDDREYHSYLKTRKQVLLRIIKSEYNWSTPHSKPDRLAPRQDLDGQMDLVNHLLIRDPIKRPFDLLFSFRDPNWLGQFDWLKDILLSS